MSTTLWRVERVHGSELSLPVGKAEALEQVRARMEREPLGDPLRVVRVVYRLDPDGPPGAATPAMRKVWRATVLRFPEVGTLGVCVCKDSSQHRFGNAGDWAAPPNLSTGRIVDYLHDVFTYQRAQGIDFEDSGGRAGLPVSEVIFRDEIATRAQGWTVRDYGGTFHAAHVHSSAYPLIDTSRPCTC